MLEDGDADTLFLLFPTLELGDGLFFDLFFFVFRTPDFSAGAGSSTSPATSMLAEKGLSVARLRLLEDLAVVLVPLRQNLEALLGGPARRVWLKQDGRPWHGE